MGKTSEKLSYLNGTKRLLRRRINSLGGSITLETKFRDYLDWLNGLYKAASAPVDFEILGETTQKAVNTATNILYLPDDEVVENGVTVTVSDGGKVTINGTPTSDMWIKLTNSMDVVYEEPPINQPLVYKNHPWASETLLEYDELKDLYLYIAKGGGTAPNISSGYDVFFVYSDNDSFWNTSSQRSIINFIPGSQTPEKRIIAATPHSVKRLNCVYIYLRENVAYNLYGYLEISETSQTTWTPNNDAAPPSPDNPKTIINKTGNIIYTASDGTEFPVSLGDIELCGSPDPNGLPDRLSYSQGMFLVEKNVSSSVFDGTDENWNYDSTADVYTGTLHGDWSYTPSNYGLSNYFKNIVDSNIVNESTAGANLNNGEFAIYYHSSGVDNTFYLKYTDLDEDDDPMEATEKLREWLSTHNTIIQYGNDGPELILITPEEYPTLYAQLQAIIDYETGIEIEEKLGG